MDGSVSDKNIYHNIFDISRSQHHIVGVSKGSHKESIALKLFQFCHLKTKQRYVPQEDVNFSERELTLLVDSLR